MPIEAMALFVAITIAVVAASAILTSEPISPLPPEVIVRYERHAALQVAWVELVAEHGRAPTTAELWARVPPEVGGEE